MQSSEEQVDEQRILILTYNRSKAREEGHSMDSRSQCRRSDKDKGLNTEVKYTGRQRWCNQDRWNTLSNHKQGEHR